jgi:hypothetical protein
MEMGEGAGLGEAAERNLLSMLWRAIRARRSLYGNTVCDTR